MATQDENKNGCLGATLEGLGCLGGLLVALIGKIIEELIFGIVVLIILLVFVYFYYFG